MEMESKKPYLIAIAIQLIYAGMFVVSKAAFDQGMNTFVFIFYRQAAASLLLLPIALVFERKNLRSMSLTVLLKLFLYAFIGNTFSLNLYYVSMKFTSATVASASSNSMPVVAFCLALLLRLEVVKLRTFSGVAKLTGIALCLAGVFVLAFYTGPPLNPVNHHRAFGITHASKDSPSRTTWIKGTFFTVLANVTWAIWIVLMAQSFVVTVVAERDFSMWKLHVDISLLAIVYTGFVVTGVSYYLQAWCLQMKGPIFLAVWNPFCFVITIFCSSFFLGEIVHLGSILGGGLLVCGLYSVLWGKSKETENKQYDEHKETSQENNSTNSQV